MDSSLKIKIVSYEAGSLIALKPAELHCLSMTLSILNSLNHNWEI